MSAFLHTERFNYRMSQIQMIVGETKTVEKKPESPAKEEGSGASVMQNYRTFVVT